MAYSIQELEFLDLTDVDETERNHLHQLLYNASSHMQFPWVVRSTVRRPSGAFEPTPFAVAPLPHPTLRGVFLPQPLYTTAPAAVAVGLVPSVTAPEPSNGPDVRSVTPISPLECNAGSIVATTTPTNTQPHGSGDGGYPSDSSQVPILSVPPSVPSSVPPSAQPVITTMYQMVGHPGMPLSNVYVGNMTANVNVHSFVGPPLAPFSQHLSQQQVFPTGDVPVPHEQSSSTSAGRNGMGQRQRPRNSKPSAKRVEGGPFVTRTSATGHDVQTVVDTTPGPPPPPMQHQNYMIPVPPMHHPHAYHQQSFYPPGQPTHGAPPHIPQHPSAQHATGTPIFLQSVPIFPHPSIYNTYHPPPPPPPQPTAGGTIVYPSNPGMIPVSVSSTEQVTDSAYQVDNGPAVRMVSESQETAVREPVQQTLYSDEGQPLKATCVKSEDKLFDYSRQDSDTESCSISSTVVVNNSNMASNTPLTSDCFKKEKDTDKDANQNVNYEDRGTEFAKFANGKVTAADKLKENVEKITSPKDNSSQTVNINEKRGSEVLPDSAKVEKGQVDDNSTCATKQSSTGDSTFASTLSPPKVNSMGTTPFGPHVSNDVAPKAPSPPCLQRRTWASLFNKSSSLSSDGPMILAVGASPNNVKPFATVRPFTNAVAVIQNATENLRHVAEMSGGISKGFPLLGHCDLPSQSLADDPQLHALGEFLSKYQLDHKAISLQPRGLTNRSNWCYINSTLQALLACPPFYNLMKSLAIPSTRVGKSSTPIIDSMVRFVNEFVPLSPASRVNRKEKAQRKDDTIEVQAGAAFEPNYIYKMLTNIQSDTFKVEGRQEDAEEFFSCLLNALNDEMLELIKLVKESTAEGNLSNGDVANGDTIQNVEADTEWKVMGKKNKGSVTRRAEFERTPVSDIFRGQLRSRVHRAGDHSDNVQPFFTLQLDIEKAQSVKEALELLVGRDQLEGLTCSRTNQEVEAWQQVTLEDLPLVLVLHLKWFHYKKDGCSKILKTVEFPIDLKVDGKLMSPYNKCNTKQKQYKLFAVVYHDGKEATKGHYVTDAYHVGYGSWVRYDDSSVKPIQENQMLHPRGSRVPYLLYYRRCDTIGSAIATPADKSR